jgi:hypothetical protein
MTANAASVLLALLLLAAGAEAADEGLTVTYFNNAPYRDDNGGQYFCSDMLTSDPPKPSWAPPTESQTKVIKSGFNGLRGGKPNLYPSSYSLRAEGWLRVGPGDKTYTFETDTDDGSLLIIDGQTVVDNDGQRGLNVYQNLGVSCDATDPAFPCDKQGSIFLKAGYYQIKFVYFNYAFEEKLKATYDNGGGGAQIDIPTTDLFTKLPGCPKGKYEKPEDTGSGTCTPCPAGRFTDQVLQTGDALTACTACPAGKYGESEGLDTPLCDGPCDKGHYCLEGSVDAKANKCRAGQFGSSTGLTTDDCSGPCKEGYWCPETSICEYGQVTGSCDPDSGAKKCPAGKFGFGGSATAECSGDCAAGHFCLAGSTQLYQYKCGEDPTQPPGTLIAKPASVFCPAGSGLPEPVQQGYYSEGLTESQGSREVICASNSFCLDGVLEFCPQGKYGNTPGMSDPACSGDCLAGYNCPEGSAVDNKEACAPAGDSKPEKYYCPKGVGRKVANSDTSPGDGTGIYTTPEVGARFYRTGASPCIKDLSVCKDGIREKNLRWPTGSPCAADLNTQIIPDVPEDREKVVETFTATTRITGPVTYSISTPSPALPASNVLAIYTISGPGPTNVGELRTENGGLNFEDAALAATANGDNPPFYTFTVTATQGADSITCAVKMEVSNVNEAPSIPAGQEFTIEEESKLGAFCNAAPGQASSTVISTDPDANDEIEYSMKVSPGTKAQPFGISKCSGQLFVDFPGPDSDPTLDFEGTKTYDVVVRATDGGTAFYEEEVKITVTNKNDAPVFEAQTLSVPENSDLGTLVGNLAATDPDGDGMDFRLTRADNPNAFNVEGTTNKLLVSEAVLDFETKKQYTIDILAEDDATKKLSTTAQITIDIANANDVPVIKVVPSSSPIECNGNNDQIVCLLPENWDPSKPFYTMTATDEDCKNFGDASDVANWRLKGQTGVAADGSCSGEIGTWSSVPNAGADWFEVDVTTGHLKVKAGKVVDFETLPISHTIDVTVEDEAQLKSLVKTVTILVTDVNEPPIIANQTIVIPENAQVATYASDPVTATDPDAGQFLRFSMVTDGSMGRLRIDAETGAFHVVKSLNHEVDASYLMKIRVADSAKLDQRLYAEAFVTITVADVNEAPTCPDFTVEVFENFAQEYNPPSSTSPKFYLPAALPLTNTPGTGSITATDVLNETSCVAEDPATCKAAVLTVNDPDAADEGATALTYTLNNFGSINPSSQFELSAASGNVVTPLQLKVKNGVALDYDASQKSYEVQLIVEDAGGLKGNCKGTINLLDVNEPPTLRPPANLVLGPALFPQEAPSPAQNVGELSIYAEDEDGDEMTFTLDSIQAKDKDGNDKALDKDNFELDSSTGTLSVANGKVEDKAKWIGIVTVEVTISVTDPKNLKETAIFTVGVRELTNNVGPTISEALRTVGLTNKNFKECISVEGTAPIKCADPVVHKFTLGKPDDPGAEIMDDIPNSLRFSVSDSSVFNMVSDPADPAFGSLVVQNSIAARANFEPAPGGVSLSLSDPAFTFKVIAADGQNLTVSFDVRVELVNVMEFPVMEVTPPTCDDDLCFFNINENPSEGDVVLGTISVADEDNVDNDPVTGSGLTLKIFGTGQNKNNEATDMFTISADKTQILVAANANIDFEATDGIMAKYCQPGDNERRECDFILRVTDLAGHQTEQNIVVIVNDINEAPSLEDPVTRYSVDENSGYGTRVGAIITTDPDSLNPAWGEQSLRCSVVNPTGQLYVSPKECILFTDNTPLDYEVMKSIEVEIMVTDEGGAGLNATKTYSVTINDVNDMTIIAAANDKSMSSKGGTKVTLSGAQIYPMWGATPSISATYGAAGQASPFVAQQCTYMQSLSTSASNQTIECVSGEGQGQDLSWTVTVGANVQGSGPLVKSAYAPPTITSATFNKKPPTEGGTGNDIIITGENFGPVVQGAVAATYSWGNAAPFTASECKVTKKHEQITCSTVAGAGSDLTFAVTTTGRTSNEVLGDAATAYQQPSITSIALNSATGKISPAFEPLGGSGLTTTGGDQIVLTGTNFGPALSPQFNPQVFYGPASNPSLLKATGCQVTKPNTEITCFTAVGVGVGLVFSAEIAGQNSTSKACADANLCKYARPEIGDFENTGLPVMYGLGAQDAVTQGGQAVRIRGRNFGSTSAVGITAKYGPCSTAACTGLNDLIYTATDCEVVQNNLIKCLTAPGTGKGHYWKVSLGSQESNAYFGDTSYAAPIVIELKTQVKELVSSIQTKGNDKITITGDNFGPKTGPGSVSTGAGTLKAFYGPTATEYNANCFVSTAHIELECTTEAGAGKDHRWSIVVNNLVSQSPQSSYARPTIDSFSGVGAANAVTSGGQDVTITGTNFGDASKSPPYLGKVTYGPSGTEFVAANCTVAEPGHTEIVCKTVPGTGATLYWIVRVQGQASEVSTASTGYAKPSITAMTPSNGPTIGVIDITVEGNNFGMNPSLYFGTTVDPGSADFGNPVEIPLQPGCCDYESSPAKITFTLPQGQGKALDVFVAAGSSATERSDAKVFKYDDPVIDLLFTEDGAGGKFQLSLYGRNFGRRDVPGLASNLAFNNTNDFSQVEVVSWSDTIIIVNVPKSEIGWVQVVLGDPAVPSSMQYSCEASNKLQSSPVFAGCYGKAFNSFNPIIETLNYKVDGVTRMTTSECAAAAAIKQASCGNSGNAGGNKPLACPCLYSTTQQTPSNDEWKEEAANAYNKFIGDSGADTSETFTKENNSSSPTQGGRILVLEGRRFGAASLIGNSYVYEVEPNAARNAPILPTVWVGEQKGYLVDQSCSSAADPAACVAASSSKCVHPRKMFKVPGAPDECRAPCSLKPFFDLIDFKTQLNAGGTPRITRGYPKIKTPSGVDKSSTTIIKCLLPPGQGVADVWVSFAGGNSDPVPFTYSAPGAPDNMQWKLSLLKIGQSVAPFQSSAAVLANTDGSTVAQLSGRNLGFAPEVAVVGENQFTTQKGTIQLKGDGTNDVNYDPNYGTPTNPTSGGPYTFTTTLPQGQGLGNRIVVQASFTGGCPMGNTDCVSAADGAKSALVSKSYPIHYNRPQIGVIKQGVKYMKILGTNFGSFDIGRDHNLTMEQNGTTAFCDLNCNGCGVDHSVITTNLLCSENSGFKNLQGVTVTLTVGGQSSVPYKPPELKQFEIQKDDGKTFIQPPNSGRLATAGGTILQITGKRFFGHEAGPIVNGTATKILLTKITVGAATECVPLSVDDSNCTLNLINPDGTGITEDCRVYATDEQKRSCRIKAGLDDTKCFREGDDSECDNGPNDPKCHDLVQCKMNRGDGGNAELVVAAGSVLSNSLPIEYERPTLNWTTVEVGDFSNGAFTARSSSFSIGNSSSTKNTTFRVSGSQLGKKDSATIKIACGVNKGTKGVLDSFVPDDDICTATVDYVSPAANSIVFTIPPGEGKGDLQLDVAGTKSDIFDGFSYIAPIVSSFKITGLDSGKSDVETTGENLVITITGTEFGPQDQNAADPTNQEQRSQREHRVMIGKYQCGFDKTDRTSWTSTEINCILPAGAGKDLNVGVVTTGVYGAKVDAFHYTNPTVSSKPELSGYTSGGTEIVLEGDNFGIDGAVVIGGTKDAQITSWTHKKLSFNVPEDSGYHAGGMLQIWPGGFEGNNPTDVGNFSYYNPAVLGIKSAEYLSTSGAGAGLVTIVGTSFGSSLEGIQVSINGLKTKISSVSHNEIKMTLNPGVGADYKINVTRSLWSNTDDVCSDRTLLANQPLSMPKGSCSTPTQENSKCMYYPGACFSYAPPVITKVVSVSPGRLIKIYGTNFAPERSGEIPKTPVDASLISLNCTNAQYGYDKDKDGKVDFMPHIKCTPPELPATRIVSSTVKSVNISLQRATYKCYRDLDGKGLEECECKDPGGNSGNLDTDYQSCEFSIKAMVGNQLGPDFNFQFQVPFITGFYPNNPDATGLSVDNLRIAGNQFGSDAEPCPPRVDLTTCPTFVQPPCEPGTCQTWKVGDECPCPPPVAIIIGEYPNNKTCLPRPKPFGQQFENGLWFKGDKESFFKPYLKCTTDRHTVGPKRTSVVINNMEYAYHKDTTPISFECRAGYYGKEDEYCEECPLGATCEGGISDPFSQLGWWMETKPSCPEPEDGSDRFDPEGKCIKPEEKCAGAASGRDECLLFIPCEPADSCAGGSQCGQCNDKTSPTFKAAFQQCEFEKGNGTSTDAIQCTAQSLCYDTHCCGIKYKGERCASCSEGYYRLAGECESCPDCPWCIVVIFICVFLGALLVGWILQRKEVNVGLMSIGVDYFQVVALFSQTKIDWPPSLLSFFRSLSIFNLNLELMAPECSFKFGYETKWFWTESVPLLGFAFFLVAHYGKYIHKRFIKNRRNKLHSHIHTMIGVSLVLMYYGYLYITRTTLDIFNCGPTSPDDGFEYMEAIFVKCYEPGGLHNNLFPWAVFFFLFYSCGYPALVGFILWRGRESAKEDQLLRANGTGATRKTNPNCFDFRKRYHKLYYNFKPDFVWWILVIILRKFLVSIAAIIFRKNASFQMAIILMVLFGSFAVQVIYRPYMSPAEYTNILEQHAADMGENSAVFDSTYRKKVHKNVKLGGEQLPTLGQTAKAVGNFFFNYNTVEATLLTSAIFICLAGIMFQSGRLSTARYAGQRTALSVWVMFLMITSIIYWIAVFITEFIITVRPDMCQKKKSAKEEAAGDGFDMNDRGLNPLHNTDGDDAARAHMGKAKAEAALQRHQAVIEQQSLEILELKKKVQANQLQSSSSRRMMKKDKGKAKKTKKAFSPVRSSSIAGEDEDDFMDVEDGVEMAEQQEPDGGGGGGAGKRDSVVPSREKRASLAVV